MASLGSAVARGSEPPELVEFEEATRARTDWASRTRSDFGPDPFRLLRVPQSNGFVGLLRGAGAVVLLDARGRELSRATAPQSPTGLAWRNEELLVVGENSPSIARYRIFEDRLQRGEDLQPSGVQSLRDVSVHGGRILLLDPIGHRIVALGDDQRTLRTLASCEGPIAFEATGLHTLANCLLEGSLVLLDSRGDVVVRITHDGPFWSTAGLEDAGRILVAAGGVENRPLDRSDGAFGHIDSFAFVYAVDLASKGVTLLHAVNLSALGIVTPKWIDLVRRDGKLRLRTAGFATSDLVLVTWDETAPERRPEIERQALPPGTTDIRGPLAANPLLDAWVNWDETEPTLEHATPTSTRAAESRLGEALFFTTLMAPWNVSDGPRSRFTCETCHHEGYVDGRTHYTGRGAVHATTKPLVGLHGNRPYFSRALDPTMARMVHNEFRVANKKNGHDPWFPLRRPDVSWLGIEGDVPEVLSPILLRRSLMTFLMEFEHAPNPATTTRASFSAVERRGATVFRDRCERCHTARLVADQPASRLPFEEWEKNLFSHGTILWGREGYEKTGIEPFVHPEGARVPSLRRLYRKRPYFTNGSAADLSAVLDGITTDASARQHTATPAGNPLSLDERESLLAFLGLL